MPPPYLVVHNISDCPIITLSLSVTAAGRENKSENIFSEEGFYVQLKKIIWFIYSQENLAAIFENTALKKKKKTSLIELPIFFQSCSTARRFSMFCDLVECHHQNIQLWGDPLHLFLEVSLRLL